MRMLQAVLNGIGMGLIICVLVGPGFFAMMSIALHYTKRAAIYFALGILLSDSTYAMIIYLGVGSIKLGHTARRWMGVVGGIIFVGMGLLMIRKTLLHQKEKHITLALHSEPNPLAFVGQGFLTNALNPSVIVFRATTVSASVATLPGRRNVLSFIIVTLLTVFATDMCKIRLAELLKHKLQGKTLHYLHIITGIILIIIGCAVIIRTLFIRHI